MRSIYRRVLTHAREHGWRSVTKKVLQRTAAKALENLALDEPVLPLRPEDIMEAARRGTVDKPRPRTGSLDVGWVCTPPGPGSGGHTTFFRMVQGLADRGQ